MRDWTLKSGDPLCLNLCADQRLCQPDYANDHIWELSLGGGDPPAVALHTSFGLRARGMRIFPRFTLDHKMVSDPAAFDRSPNVVRFYPNYLQIQFEPFSGIDAVCEYWVPESHAVLGRLRITNRNVVPRALRMEWIVLLVPLGDGQRMSAAQFEINHILQGRSGGLEPVFFLTGGPSPGAGPFPSLYLDVELAPGSSRQFTWALASLHAAEASFEHARRLTARPWDAELARIELLNEQQAVEINTGDPDWDAALAFAQTQAFRLFMGPSASLPYPSFVSARQPDHGFSPRGDGRDYGPLWNGQTALESYYLSTLILPGGADLVKGLIRNFIAAQAEDGALDWKPGLAGQRGSLPAQPLLASLAMRLFSACEDLNFLRETFRPLSASFERWFDPDHDRDQDGAPEWDHPLQSGFEENPAFDRWRPHGRGLDIRAAESPALTALLLRECQSLAAMARLIGHEDALTSLNKRQERLERSLREMWDARRAVFRYRDRDTHLCPPGRMLFHGRGPGPHAIGAEFDSPRRLVIQLATPGQTVPRASLSLRGRHGRRRIEEIIPPSDVFWIPGQAWITTSQVYTRLDTLAVDGLPAHAEVTARTAAFSHDDITCLAPLWSGRIDPRWASSLVRRSITSPQRYGRLFGLPACPSGGARHDPACSAVHMPWNQIVGEGLLANGFQNEAAALVTRLMAAVIQTLKHDRAFYSQYNADSGRPAGVRGGLGGLAPIGLFLETLGVRLISPWKVAVWGRNPFPWDVTVRYRGLTVLRSGAKTLITFPDGQPVSLEKPEFQVVFME